MKKIILRFTCVVACLFIMLVSCRKGVNDPGVPPVTDPVLTGNADVDALLAMQTSSSFNYETYKDIILDISILAPDNTPIKNIPISIFTKAEEIGGILLFKSMTDNQGKVSGKIKFPTYLNEVVVDAKYLGVIRNAAVQIVGSSILCTLGGSNGYAGNVVLNSPLSGRPAKKSGGISQRPLSAYHYLGSYDNQGKPNYLDPVKALISADFLANINASLPERQPVMSYHPDYLSNNIETNLNISALSDVWFTFVTEGAGYRSSIAYFTYPTNTPPQKTSEIDTLHIILPNASLAGSGGDIQPGSTIKLGRFSAGTSIGFALIADGWNGSTVGDGNGIVYSLDQLNPASDTKLKRQSILLYDNAQSLFLAGFEDIRRDNSACDNDFNDCIFYLKGNPVTAISTSNVNPIDKPVDKDGDGVNDTYDAFPDDPTRAYINYYPAQNTMGTIAFEDNWPYLGDYDLNDLVVGYQYTIISDALNRTIQMKAKYVLKASGAAFRNGFGVEFPFGASLVKSATGSTVTDNLVVTLGVNGCETGQTKAVIIPFDDAYTAMNNTKIGFNTFTGNPFLSRDTIVIDLSFTRPLLADEMGTAPYNPFIIIDRTRGREAHLAGYSPTQKADARYFNTGVDKTRISQNMYYKTSSNLPWGLAFTEDFSYPAEGKAINAAYTQFVPWAISNGANNGRWYKDTANMVNSFIYKR